MTSLPLENSGLHAVLGFESMLVACFELWLTVLKEKMIKFLNKLLVMRQCMEVRQLFLFIYVAYPLRVYPYDYNFR